MAADGIGYAVLSCWDCSYWMACPWVDRLNVVCDLCKLGDALVVLALVCENCRCDQRDHLLGHTCLFAPAVFSPAINSADIRHVWNTRGKD